MRKGKNIFRLMVIGVMSAGWMTAFCSDEIVDEYYEFERNGVSYSLLEDSDCPILLQVVHSHSYSEMNKISVLGEIEVRDDTFFNHTRIAIVTQIASNAFNGCNKINEINLPPTIRWIGSDAFNGVGMTNISLPEGLAYIGPYAFANTSLHEIIVPESVKLLDFKCFSGNELLTKVSLPSTLTELGGYTFYLSSQIRDLYCFADIPPKASGSDFGVFECPEYYRLDHLPGPDMEICKLHVPATSIDAYRNADGWENFVNIVAIEDDITIVDEIELSEVGIDLSIGSGVLCVNCKKGDRITVYNEDGIKMSSSVIQNNEAYTYRGRGLYILQYNDKSIKVKI